MLATLVPSSIAIAIGPITIHWYGLIMVVAVLVSFFIVRYLATQRGVMSGSDLSNLAFYLIVFGWIGARLYHVLGSMEYYWQYPGQILAVWNGGLAIHGGLIAGAIVTIIWARQTKVALWPLFDVLSMGVVAGQAIGRWGNFFNQELYGTPTNLPWKIMIDAEHRLPGLVSEQFFHPLFLYESLLNLFLFIILIIVFRARRLPDGCVAMFYVAGYSVIRFFLEHLRVDDTLIVLDLRFAQLVSIVGCVIAIMVCAWLVSRRARSQVIADTNKTGKV